MATSRLRQLFGFRQRRYSENQAPRHCYCASAFFSCGINARILHRHASTRRDSPSYGAEVDDCYFCAMAGALQMVYFCELAPIRPDEHFLMSGRPWEMPYPEFERTTLAASPPDVLQSALEYLVYISFLLRRAESFQPFGHGARPGVSCRSGESTYGPRRFRFSTRWFLFRPIVLAISRCGGSWIDAESAHRPSPQRRIPRDVSRVLMVARYEQIPSTAGRNWVTAGLALDRPTSLRSVSRETTGAWKYTTNLHSARFFATPGPNGISLRLSNTSGVAWRPGATLRLRAPTWTRLPD